MVQMESDDALERGEVVPSFDLPGTDGDTHALADYGDYRAVLLVFTCNHCPYAQAKFEALNALAEEYDDLAVIGVNPNDDEEYPEDSFERMRELVEDGTIRYDAYLRDETQEVARAYDATCTPDPFLLERDDGGSGAFRLAYHGRLDDALNPDDDPSGDPGFEMREHVERVLAGEPIGAESRPSRGCSIKWKEE